MQIATQHLIAACARLDPASRALLNLWVHRGLDDEAIARLTHSSSAWVAGRRSVLIDELAQELGVTSQDVHGALERLASPHPEEEGGAAVNPRPAAADNGATAQAEAPTAPPPPRPPDAARPEPTESRPRRPARRSGLIAGAALLILAALLIVLLSPTGARRRARPPGSSRPAVAAVAPAVRLVSLPGGPAGASGTVRLSGSIGNGGHLALSATGLPAAGTGHYVIWLYSSIIDSVALGTLPSDGAVVKVALPRDAARYRYLDVSLQPAGVSNHSGESVLRAAVADL